MGLAVCDLESASTATLYTIGYSGKQVDAFIWQLVEARVALLVDIRRLPLSRHKPMFSKSNLADLLLRIKTDSGPIGYWHVPLLGSDPELRKTLAITGDYVYFFQAFRRYLTGANQQAALLAVAAQLALHQRIALLCTEAKAEECHRSAVAESIYSLLGGKPGMVHL